MHPGDCDPGSVPASPAGRASGSTTPTRSSSIRSPDVTDKLLRDNAARVLGLP